MNVTLCGKRDFEDVIKLRILKWRDYPGLFMWALNTITSVSIRKRPEGDLAIEGDVMMEARDRNDVGK